VVIALPPYLTTTVCPLREEMEEAMVMAFSAKDDESEERDVDVLTDFWCRDDDDDIDGANACDVLATIVAARRMVLAEKSFMVVMIVSWMDMCYYRWMEDMSIISWFRSVTRVAFAKIRWICAGFNWDSPILNRAPLTTNKK